MDQSNKSLTRRNFLKKAGATAGLLGAPGLLGCATTPRKRTDKPNLVYVFADQWRAHATGYAGDPNVHTPNLDRLAGQSVNFANAVSCCPVCTPYRASLMTGQYPLTNGLFLNDLRLGNHAVSIAQVYSEAGYDTAYIGKWHLDGPARSSYIPPERRHGFDYWKVLECTHKYNESYYYAGDDPTKRMWEGYDAIAQTQDAKRYITEHANRDNPFILFLSWGPPHNPYGTAPRKYKDMCDPKSITLRPNVPEESRKMALKDLAGYYAHIAALDDCLGEILRTLDSTGIAENTIFVFTADHGDMLGSQGHVRKQRPWDESIRVPFLLRYPEAHGNFGRTINMPIGAPDIMPTLLGLSGIAIPQTVEGTDYSGIIRGAEAPADNPVLIMCPSPFGEWKRGEGREYRGVRTVRYTYVRDLKGPWLLYDNKNDPYQMKNLVNSADDLQSTMEMVLQRLLTERNDDFLPGDEYVKRWGYEVDERGNVPYTS
jgi:arylsulfatase A-like enzyme